MHLTKNFMQIPLLFECILLHNEKFSSDHLSLVLKYQLFCPLFAFETSVEWFFPDIINSIGLFTKFSYILACDILTWNLHEKFVCIAFEYDTFSLSVSHSLLFQINLLSIYRKETSNRQKSSICVQRSLSINVSCWFIDEAWIRKKLPGTLSDSLRMPKVNWCLFFKA